MIVLKIKQLKLENEKFWEWEISETKESLFQIIYETRNFNNTV